MKTLEEIEKLALEMVNNADNINIKRSTCFIKGFQTCQELQKESDAVNRDEKLINWFRERVIIKDSDVQYLEFILTECKINP